MIYEEKNLKPDFVLKCKIKVIRQSYYEIANERTHETKSVLLLPDLETTEAQRLLMTYLPSVSTICTDCGNDDLRTYAHECNKCKSRQVKTEHCELPTWIASPSQSPCRVALLRKNNYCNQHHLVVMSTGVEEELIPFEGRHVEVSIFPGEYDSICDTAPSINRTAAIK